MIFKPFRVETWLLNERYRNRKFTRNWKKKLWSSIDLLCIVEYVYLLMKKVFITDVRVRGESYFGNVICLSRPSKVSVMLKEKF